MEKSYLINRKTFKIVAITSAVLFTLLFALYFFDLFTVYIPAFKDAATFTKIEQFVLYTLTSLLNEVAAIYLLMTLINLKENKKTAIGIYISSLIFFLSGQFYLSIVIGGSMDYLIFFIIFTALAVALFLSIKVAYKNLSANENKRHRLIRDAAITTTCFALVDFAMFFVFLMLFAPESESGVFTITNYVDNIVNNGYVFYVVFGILFIWSSLFVNLVFGIELWKKSLQITPDKQFAQNRKYLINIATVTFITVPIFLPTGLIIKALRGKNEQVYLA